jgi:hypothetical protein
LASGERGELGHPPIGDGDRGEKEKGIEKERQADEGEEQAFNQTKANS